jgi:ribosomal protein L30/L7E
MSKTFLGLKLIRSPIGTPGRQLLFVSKHSQQNWCDLNITEAMRQTLKKLKLTHMNKTIYREATPGVVANTLRGSRNRQTNTRLQSLWAWLTRWAILYLNLIWFQPTSDQAKMHIKVFDVAKADVEPIVPKRPLQL